MKRRKHLIAALFFLLMILFVWEFPLFPQERFRKSPPNPEPLPALKLPAIDSFTLTNGLALSVIQQDNMPVISLKMIIFAGESHSPEKLPGLATLTAKMLSRGVSYLSFSKIEERIEFIGGNFSVTIYPDYTLLSFTFLEDYLKEGIELLYKMLLQPTFFKREIINVKRSMYYDLIRESRDPEFIAKRQLRRILFSGHNHMKSTYNEDVIKNLSQKDIVSFFQKYYRPNNAHLILTGDINLPTASRKVSSYFRNWRRRELKHTFVPPPKSNTKLRICFVDVRGMNDAWIYMGNVISTMARQETFPLIVLNQVLGGTRISRLFMNLRESKEYAYWAFSEVEFFRNFNVFFVRAKVRVEVTYDSIMEILKETKKITDKKIPSFEIEQAKSFLIGNFPLHIQTFDNLSAAVSEIKALNLGEEHWEKYYDNIMLINSEKAFEMARTYDPLSPVVVIVGDSSKIIDHIQEFAEIEIYNSKGILRQKITHQTIKKENSNEAR
jgi:predicted Zn-dependent peptidase